MRKILLLLSFAITMCAILPLQANAQWNGSGTGFALYNKYVVTNYHVIKGAIKIGIFTSNSEGENEFTAEVYACDTTNDLAILKILDNSFMGFGGIPYCIKTQLCDIGEDVFTLGFPLISTMGNNVKLSTGVISSQTGFKNDASLYQISTPIQPGNSGGPLFDNKGNLVGVVCAYHAQAESVGYAIKASYLYALANKYKIPVSLSPNNTKEQVLTESVKKYKNFIVLIKCIKEHQPIDNKQNQPIHLYQMNYTTSDEQIIQIADDAFNAQIVSHEYKNGIGVIYFNSPVTTIKKNAFRDCQTLTNINIPNTVTTIEDFVFHGCHRLEKVFIPNSVQYIGNSIFRNCSGLKSINGKYASTDSRCLVVNGKLKAFAPQGLITYVIPNNVTSIGEWAFCECNTLTNIMLPSSIKTIENNAIAYCSQLKSLTIPYNVAHIGDGAITGCCNLSSFSGKYSSVDKKCLIFNGKIVAFAPAEITSYTVPDNVVEIGDWAFAYCEDLREIVIGEGVRTIGRCAFRNCSALSKIIMPQLLTSIKEYAFYYCSKLNEIKIPSNVVLIGRYAFADCYSLIKVIIPNNVTHIEESAFRDCKSLNVLTIGSSVFSIGKNAFLGCTNLTTIYCRASTPPAICDLYQDWNTSPRHITASFPEEYENIRFYVPRNSYGEYTNITISMYVDAKKKHIDYLNWYIYKEFIYAYDFE